MALLLDLNAVEVRLVSTTDERRRWDARVTRHHYRSYYHLFGKALRQVPFTVRLGWRGWAGGDVR